MTEDYNEITPGTWSYASGEVVNDAGTVIARAERDANLARDIPPYQRSNNMRAVAALPDLLKACEDIIAGVGGAGIRMRRAVDKARGRVS